MFEKIFIIFGLKCEQSLLNQFFTGIIITALLSYSLFIGFSLCDNINIFIILLKCLSLSIGGSILASYLYIKYRSKKIINLYRELKHFHKFEINLKNDGEYGRILSLLIIYITISVINLIIIYHDNIFETMFKTYYFQPKILFVFISLYLFGWYLSLYYIYFEIKIKYYKIVKNIYKLLIEKEFTRNNRPKYEDILYIQQTINMLTHFQSVINNYIDISIYFIYSVLLTMNTGLTLYLYRIICFGLFC